MREQYGREKGDEFFWRWVNKHGYDETKPVSTQKSKAEANPVAAVMEVFDDFDEDEETTDDKQVPDEEIETPLHDRLDRREDSDKIQAKTEEPQVAAIAGKDGSPTFISVPAFKVPYVAAPKFEGKDAPLIIKALVLEEGHNVNNWRVVQDEFPRVAEQYKAGRHLRINHGKNVEDVIGKSFDAHVLKGADVELYLGKPIEGIDQGGLYVAAEFEANPRDLQVRTNILDGYVETGSIGLDANAYCETCDKPIEMKDDGTVDKPCRHYDAPIKLRNVEVKEYSYVAEPAFPHTKAFPSFGAAVSATLLHKESSLSQSQTVQSIDMPDTDKSKVEALAAAATAKKADAEGEGDDEMIPKKYAEAIMEAYKKGLADSTKFRAEPDPDSDDDKKKGEASASVTATKTDQVAKVAEPEKAGLTKDQELVARVLFPSRFSMDTEPWIKEVFKAAADAPKAPLEVKQRWKKYESTGRFE